MKKLICLSIALLMLLVAFAACTPKTPEGTIAGGENSDVDVTDAPTDQYGQVIQTPPIPEDANYGGTEIGIYVRNDTQDDRYRREFSTETPDDPVDNKVLQRNKAIESQINVKLLTIEYDNPGTDSEGYANAVLNTVKDPQSKVDIVAIYGAYASNPSLRQSYVNLQDKEKVKYMAMENLYWNQSYIEAGTCYGQLYTIVGDINLTVYDKAIVTFFNRTLAEQEKVVDSEELYEKVLNGQWTYQDMYDIVKAFPYEDTDESTTVTVGDKVPYASNSYSEHADGYFNAWEMSILTTTNSGSHVVNIEDNTKLQTGVERMIALHELEGVLLIGGVSETFPKSFLAGNALFDVDILFRNFAVNKRLREEVSFDYAILPLPMYDTDQKDESSASLGYKTTPQDAYNALSVLAAREDDLEAITVTLELMASKSYEDVRPYYIRRVVKSTYVSGAKEEDMVDLAISGSYFTTDQVYLNQTNYFNTTMWRGTINAKGTISDRWDKYGDQMITAINDFDMWFESNT